MKKLFALLLVVATLLCCALPAYAVTEEEVEEFITQHFANAPDYEKMMVAASRLELINDTAMNAPRLQMIKTEDGFYKIDCTYIPEYYVKYLHNNTYYTPTEQDVTRINVLLRIDDGEWVSELYGPLAQIFTAQQTLQNIPNQEQTFTIFDFSKVDPELTEGPYIDLIEQKDGMFYIDLTKHTIEVKLEVIYEFHGTPYNMPHTPSAKVLELTETTIPDTLPIPSVTRPIISTKTNQLSCAVQPNEIINALQNLGHQCYVVFKYKVNDEKESKEQMTPVGTQAYNFFELKNIEYDKENMPHITLLFAYYDATTETYSEWSSCVPQIQEQPDELAQNPHTNENTDNTIIQCGLCKQCSRPLNICIWFLIPGGVLILVAITCAIAGIIKSKHNNSNKEKKHA